MVLKKILFNLYGFGNLRIRRIIKSIICRLEDGEYLSKTLREIYKEYHQVDIGLYTHGGCFIPFNFDRHTKIGRFCSIAITARAMNRNHPLEFKSTHAFFCISTFGLTKQDLITHIPLKIGNDVWIGHNAIIMPHVKVISDGAVIAAGAVVNKDVPPYAVMVGNPARVVRYRFDEDTISYLIDSEWWKESIEQLKNKIGEFQQPYQEYYRNNVRKNVSK